MLPENPHWTWYMNAFLGTVLRGQISRRGPVSPAWLPSGQLCLKGRQQQKLH